MLAGWKEDLAKYSAEKRKKEEPIEARVLSAILNTSNTPYRYFTLQISTSDI